MISKPLGSLLHECSKAKAFRNGVSLHAAVLKTGRQSDVLVCNHLLNMYAKCGNVGVARQVFDDMSERNLVSWSAMVSGYDQASEPMKAIDLFSQMPLVPNEYIYSSAISACASVFAVTQGQQIHAQSLKFGYASISFVSNSLISMYMKCGRCSDALNLYDCTAEPNSVSYNALIAGFVENRQPERGFEVLKLMYQQGLVPDRFTFVGLFRICTTIDYLQRGKELHCQTFKLKLHSSAFIGNVIVTMYSKFNLILEAEKVFSLIEEKDVISWNTLISACSHCDDHVKGLRVFREMKGEIGDAFTFSSALAACAGLASIHHGKQIHARLIRLKLYQDVGVGNALVNMYAKCGCIRCAHDIFNKMVHHNLVTWNTIIAGFGNYGLGGEALELFEQMKEKGVKPDSVTFVALLAACNHAGLVDKGRSYFNCMEETYGIAPNVEHFSCLIDLLGRAGRLIEAEEYMRKFPFGDNQIVLGSLLSACRLHGDVVIGERLYRRLQKLQPVTTSPYVLSSNLFASEGRWGDVAEARKMLRGSGLKKEPGYSLIEVKGVFERFTIGDFSHSRIGEIMDVLNSMSWEVGDISPWLALSV